MYSALHVRLAQASALPVQVRAGILGIIASVTTTTMIPIQQAIHWHFRQTVWHALISIARHVHHIALHTIYV
jgi:hypothetical protein